MLRQRAASPIPVVLFSILLQPAILSGQANGTVQTEHERGAPVAQALQMEEPIRVDGQLDEGVWSRATAVTDFTQREPQEGAPVSERTEVRIVYDEAAIYIGAMLHDSAPPSTRLGRRDADFDDSDLFVVELDSYHDHRTAFSFSINPSEVPGDRVIGGGGGGGGGRGFGGGGDETWDPVWDAATAVTDSGWSLEMRIPFSQLRFSSAAVQTWGIQLERQIARKQETAQFAFTPLLERGGVPRYGHLVGLRGVEAQNPLEIMPYASMRADYRLIPLDPRVDFPNPYLSGSDFAGGFGADMKYRLSSNITVDATLNPDFGQVEVDPAVVNLSAFETRFDERRPFFIEGADIFRFGGGGGQLLYSRRIGASPKLDTPDAAIYSDVPDQTTIVGAAKITGRTAGGWSFGIMEALTPRESAPFVRLDGTQDEAVVEPLSNYFAGRVRRDLREGRTVIGALVTAVNRDLTSDPMRDELRSAGYAGGADFGHEWADRTWGLNGGLSFSHIRGTPAVLVAAQRSSARYFHRPDATHLEVDPNATTMSGFAGSIFLGKRAGAVTGGIGLNTTSPQYEVNDLGFQTTADRIEVTTEIGYEETEPGPIFRSWEANTGPDLTLNYGGQVIGAGIGVFSRAEFVNYWEGEMRFFRNGGTLDDRLTRGGPLTRDPVRYSFGFEVETDPRNSYTVGPGFDFDYSPAGGWASSVDVEVEWRPTENWNVEISPEVSWEHDNAQYVTSVGDPLATHSFGRRYLFADLRQTEVALSTRMNITFTPTLTFELYAQPLLASGEYTALKELSAPRTYEFDVYGTDQGTSQLSDGRYTIDPDGEGPASSFQVSDRDFNVRSLRGNAVLRWEYRPGSTLYLVWQQRRADELDAFLPDADDLRVGRFDFGRDARELFGLRPDNIFMIKASYWINP